MHEVIIDATAPSSIFDDRLYPLEIGDLNGAADATVTSTAIYEYLLLLITSATVREILSNKPAHHKRPDIRIKRLCCWTLHRSNFFESRTKVLSKIPPRSQLKVENAIIAMVYVDRLCRSSDHRLTRHTWRRILLGAVIISSKVWDDARKWRAVVFVALDR